VYSRVHKQTWSRDELVKFQPGLAEACRNGVFNLKEEYPIVSIVKGMTFLLIELESLEALQCVGLSGMSLSSDKMGLDEGWSRTFVGMYFFVRCGDGADGETLLRTRMIEGKFCNVYTACQLPASPAEVQRGPHMYPLTMHVVWLMDSCESVA
jgi:hypothetical protein